MCINYINIICSMIYVLLNYIWFKLWHVTLTTCSKFFLASYPTTLIFYKKLYLKDHFQSSLNISEYLNHPCRYSELSYKITTTHITTQSGDFANILSLKIYTRHSDFQILLCSCYQDALEPLIFRGQLHAKRQVAFTNH